MEAIEHIIKYGNNKIPIKLIFKKIKHISISVNPDKKVEVVAPLSQTVEKAVSKVMKRAKWIKKQIDYFDQYHPLPTKRKFISGETHYYLGRRYRLKIKKRIDESVKLKGGYIYINAQHNDKDAVKALLYKWYGLHAEPLFNSYILQIAKKLGIPCKSIRIQIKLMSKRWGSCSKNKLITLNIELIKTPNPCIEYVIAHELCHLVEQHHGNRFYQLLSKVIPNWKDRKKRLDSFII